MGVNKIMQTENERGGEEKEEKGREEGGRRRKGEEREKEKTHLLECLCSLFGSLGKSQ